MASKSQRSFGLSQEQVAELTAEYDKSKKFPNPYRTGAYAHTVTALVTLGADKPHSLAKVHQAFKRAAGAEWYAAWAGQEKRNEDTGLDAAGKFVQNLRVLQRTADYGKKFLDVGREVLKSKGAAIDLTRDGKGGLLVALNLDSDAPLKPGRPERVKRPSDREPPEAFQTRQDATGASKGRRRPTVARKKLKTRKPTDRRIVPDDWQVKPVGAMGEVCAGKALAAHAPGTMRPYLRTKNVFDGCIVINDVLEMPMTDAEFTRFRLRYGDVLLNEGQSIELVGRCAMYRDEYPEPCAIQNQLVRFRAHADTSAEFATHLFRWCQARGIFSAIAMQTTSVAHLGVSRFHGLPLAWPSTKAEQDSIAVVLNETDSFIEALERLIAKKRHIRQAMMYQLLTGVRRLPGFRKHWRRRALGDLFQFFRSASISRSGLRPEGEVAYLHYGDIHAHASPFFCFSRDCRTYVAHSFVVSVNRLRDGDLVLADASEDTTAIGKAVEVIGLSGREAVAGLHTMVLRADKSDVADGFKGYLQFIPAMRTAIVRLASGVSVYGISKAGVRTIELELPDVDEQSEIAAVLRSMGDEIEILEAKLGKSRQLKISIARILLRGEVRLTNSDLMPRGGSASELSRKSVGHNRQINEAAVISVLAKAFGSKEFPLGRMRYTKLCYLLHRHIEHRVEGYSKKAADGGVGLTVLRPENEDKMGELQRGCAEHSSQLGTG